MHSDWYTGVIRHHTREYTYCDICNRMSFEEQMNDCKETFVSFFRFWRTQATPVERQIVLTAKHDTTSSEAYSNYVADKIAGLLD